MTQLGHGMIDALTLANVLAALLGALLGTAVGVVPGMAPTAVLGLFLPVITVLAPETGLIFLGSVYFGTQYGDSMSAILLNVPSESPAVVIARDGYAMTRKGRGGAALTIAAVASFVGGTVGVIGLALLAPQMSSAALSFGPASFFDVAIVGMIVLSGVSGGSIWCNCAALAIGVALTTFGQDPIEGSARLTFGMPAMLQGFDVVPIAIGMFGMTEVLSMVVNAARSPAVRPVRLREMPPTKAEWRQATPAVGRGTIVGFLLGILPGPALTLATYTSYWFERIFGRGPTKIGDGAPNAVAGPKAADDAGVGATLAPVLVLGLPFTPVTAVLYAGLLLTGLAPGPQFITQNPTIFWDLIAGLLVANVMLLILNLPLVTMWVSLLRIPRPLLSGIMFVLMMVGTFSLRNSDFDVVVMLVAGIVGAAFKAAGIDRALVILGLVLGPIMETSLRQSLNLSDGSMRIFVEGRLNATIVGALVVLVAANILYKLRKAYLRKLPKGTSEPNTATE